MIRYILKQGGVVTNAASFESRELGDAWLSFQQSEGSFRYEDLIIPAIPEDSEGRGKPEEIILKTHDLEIIENYVNQDEVNELARKYLADTDWYVVRQIETGVAVPEEISQLRSEARAKVQ